ncbi:glycoside hydrolase family 16 protein [Mucilaginibacter sp. BJC16-A38]|uniref:glycoside hydrolase family 16 protein n=1 Tax=Mucilaginibacter phenanthrenivorans TaxID=1234842 RepID=UPI0021577276|nr:glycoside hydrolase family 16 protein [Mucilaginibacter phenanthrenivorans]MCR8561460.1 glycoside hydrolase family 16 protein [Mucilaginibacter phenanthrenivorans]
MKKINFLIIPVLVLGFFACSKKQAVLPPFVPLKTEPKVYSFDTTSVAWGDDFSTDGAPDPGKWTYDTGGSGWGNHELEYYTSTTNNANISGGILSITAKKESMGGMNYTSARMVSKTPATLLYGRIEVKAKLPAGVGTWPAIWMLPNDYAYGNWPNSGEVDIMEMVGFDPNVVHFSIHDQTNFGGNSKSGMMTIPTASTDYHIYRADWTPDGIKGYYDGVLVYSFANGGTGSATWPFDKPFHILLNLAIGGDWGGTKGVDDTIFPVAMQVDYVHYYNMVTK